jgi:hypothetical protein
MDLSTESVQCGQARQSNAETDSFLVLTGEEDRHGAPETLTVQNDLCLLEFMVREDVV